METYFTILIAAASKPNNLFSRSDKKPAMEIHYAANGEILIQLAKKYPSADMVFIMLDLPGFEYEETIAALKSLNPGMPVVLLVNYLNIQSLRLANILKCDDIIHLPLEPEKLLALIGSYHSTA